MKEFMFCNACAGKPSMASCDSCIHNKKLIENLQAQIENRKERVQQLLIEKNQFIELVLLLHNLLKKSEEKLFNSICDSSAKINQIKEEK